jgi:antitoxin ParD1/3/4
LKAEDAVRLEALRSAVAMSIEDIEAGCFKTFDSSDALRKRVKPLTWKVISEV